MRQTSLKMKVTVTVFFVVASILSLALRSLVVATAVRPLLVLLLPVLFGAAFGVYGVVRSRRARLDPLNDVPNAFRVFLASAGGVLLFVSPTVFLFPSAGLLLFLVSVYLNDEFQRRAIDSVRRGRRGGSVALLGIDGSGKSTHSAQTSGWLQGRGYLVTLMPFHKYLFVERLASMAAALRGRRGRPGRTARGGGAAVPAAPGSGAAAAAAGAVSIGSTSAPSRSGAGGSGVVEKSKKKKKRSPLRPVLSLVDNLLLQLASSIGCRVEGRVVIYDRFIWSTYVKYEALGYPVRPLSFLYLLPKPLFAIVLDVPVEKSLKVIDERTAHIRYPGAVLQRERERYLKIAEENGYPVIDATRPFEDVQASIEMHLSRLFPAVQGAHAR